MIVEEILNEKLVKHYSDSGVMIRQIEMGIVYLEAVDVIPCAYTYEETDIPMTGNEFSEKVLPVDGVEPFEDFEF